MKLNCSHLSALVAACAWIAGSLPFKAPAQVPGAHIAYVYPAGGKQGESFTIRIGGQTLDGVTNAFVTGEGVKASVVEFKKPLTQAQVKMLREQLQELQARRLASRPGSRGASGKPAAVFTAEDAKKLEEIRKQLAGYQRRPMNPAFAETVTVRVDIDPAAPPGKREIRLETRLGLTNPMIFCVGTLPEFRKFEPSDDQPPPLRRAGLRGQGTSAAQPTDTRITLPAVVNGQLLPGGTDRFHFHARKGQKIVASVSARDIIPYLADAVPGWLQATLTLYDPAGKELAYDDDFQFRPDPVLACEIPRDGDYVAEIKDSIYRGREDFVYRVAIGELPFVTGIYPLGGRAGEEVRLELSGWNLPATNLVVKCPAEPGICSLKSLPGNRAFGDAFNSVVFETGTLSEIGEREPNDTPATAATVALPVVINGRIGQPGDADFFCFAGKAGQKVVAEVMARRLGGPLDSILRLTDASGKQLAVNDDHTDPGRGLDTHHADSLLDITLPVDGKYYINIADVQGRGGPEFGYRLRLSAPRPDFALRVVPSSINARPGLNVPLTVYAMRKDGFTNAIRIGLDNAPPGFSIAGARIPEGADRVRITLGVPGTGKAGLQPVKLSMTGSAIVGDARIEHPVVPAEDMMQAFFYRHLVPSQEMEVAVIGRSFARAIPRLLDDGPIKIPAGGTARVRLAAPGGALGNRLQLELSEPPEGISIKEIVPGTETLEIVLQSDAAKARPGTVGNLILAIVPGGAPAATQKGKAPNARRTGALGCLPALTFEIIKES